jgi:membrane protease YdiL (CAAX protease family)
MSILTMMSTVFGSAFFEEVIFRFIPIVYTLKFTRSLYVVVSVTIVSSVIFGYVHGGFGHVPLQGVAGLFFSMVYIKTGGYLEMHRDALLTTTLIHFLYNMFILLPIMIFGIELWLV